MLSAFFFAGNFARSQFLVNFGPGAEFRQQWTRAANQNGIRIRPHIMQFSPPKSADRLSTATFGRSQTEGPIIIVVGGVFVFDVMRAIETLEKVKI